MKKSKVAPIPSAAKLLHSLRPKFQGKARAEASSDAESVDSMVVDFEAVGSSSEDFQPAPKKTTARGKKAAAAPAKKAPAKKAPAKRGKRAVRFMMPRPDDVLNLRSRLPLRMRTRMRKTRKRWRMCRRPSGRIGQPF